MQHLTTKTFKEKILNYDVDKTKWLINKPTIIDIWAPWCGPCRVIAPIFNELEEEFKDRIDIYKIDVDENPEIAATFGIKSIPAVLFIPIDGEPEISIGAMSKIAFIHAIEEFFKIK